MASRSACTYGPEPGGRVSTGRVLDPALLDLARAAGAEVRLGHAVASVDLDARRLHVRGPDGTLRPAGASHRRRRRPALGRRAGRRRRAANPPARRGSGSRSTSPTTGRSAVGRADAPDPRRLRRGGPGAGRAGERRDRARVRRGDDGRARRRAGGRATRRGRPSRPPPDDPGAWRAGRPLDEVAGRLADRRAGRPAGRAAVAAGGRRGGIPRPVHGRGATPRARLRRARRRPPSTVALRGATTERSPPTTARWGAGSWPRTRLVAGPGVPRPPALFEYAARRLARATLSVRRWAW